MQGKGQNTSLHSHRLWGTAGVPMCLRSVQSRPEDKTHQRLRYSIFHWGQWLQTGAESYVTLDVKPSRDSTVGGRAAALSLCFTWCSPHNTLQSPATHLNFWIGIFFFNSCDWGKNVTPLYVSCDLTKPFVFAFLRDDGPSHLESVTFYIPTPGWVLILQGSPMIHCLGDTVCQLLQCVPLIPGWW